MNLLVSPILFLKPFCQVYCTFHFRFYFQKTYTDHKDCSSIVLNEIFNGIKVLKLYAWERSFEKKVGDIRRKEMLELTKIRILGSLGRFLWESTPQLVSFLKVSVQIPIAIVYFLRTSIWD